MPFARSNGHSFTAASITAHAPEQGGIYGLSNSRIWIYIYSVDNIRAALLDHLHERNPDTAFRSVTSFAFELCNTAERSRRCVRLIEELHPVVPARAQWP